LVQKLPNTNSQLHICFTRRHFPPLDLDYVFEICVKTKNRKDISTYIKAELPTPRIPDIIREIITGYALGLFIWVHLVISRVLHLERRFVGWKAIEAQINAIPLELNKVYLEHI
jgi:hypothetical protein